MKLIFRKTLASGGSYQDVIMNFPCADVTENHTIESGKGSTNNGLLIRQIAGVRYGLKVTLRCDAATYRALLDNIVQASAYRYEASPNSGGVWTGSQAVVIDHSSVKRVDKAYYVTLQLTAEDLA